MVHADWLALLKQWLDAGRSIESVSMNRCPGEDDDRLLMQFGEHDPAISPSASLQRHTADRLTAWSRNGVEKRAI